MASDEEQGPSNRLCGCLDCAPAPGEGSLWVVLAAELAGSALLVLLSCLAANSSATAPLLHRALAGGLVVTLLVQFINALQCFDHISGAMFNPTVTLAAVVRRRVSARAGALMLPAQAAGAVAGAALLQLFTPPPPPALADNAPSVLQACLTLPAEHLPLYKAVCVEALLGGLLALANCASWDRRNRLLADSWPLRVGLIAAALGLVAGDLTGASMNPVRSLGPALCTGDFTHHWVYWVGPLGGSLACSLLYGCVWAAAAGAPCRADPLLPPAPAPASQPAPAALPALADTLAPLKRSL